MRTTTFLLLALTAWSCGNEPAGTATASSAANPAAAASIKEDARHFRGAISNGMKGDSLFFDLSADGKTLSNLTFQGYWRCAGRLEQTRTGPEGTFAVVDGKVKGHLSEPPGGGATSWRFELDATIRDTEAQGSFRMNINNLGCDTYQLQWTARSAAD